LTNQLSQPNWACLYRYSTA